MRGDISAKRIRREGSFGRSIGRSIGRSLGRSLGGSLLERFERLVLARYGAYQITVPESEVQEIDSRNRRDILMEAGGVS